MYEISQIIKQIIINNKNKKKLVAITAAAVTIMLVVSVGTIGAAPFSSQQPQGPPSDQATGPRVTSANIEDEAIVSADLQDGAAVRSTDIVDGQVTTEDLADDAVTSDKIRDGEVKVDDLDPSLRGGVPGEGFELQVTERSNTIELPRTRGEFTVRVECNPDEVVTGGGFAASLSPQGTSPTGIPKESRKAANGWEVHWDVAGVDAT